MTPELDREALKEKRLSVAERIFQMQSRVEEEKFTPRMAVSGSVTPKAAAAMQFFRYTTKRNHRTGWSGVIIIGELI